MALYRTKSSILVGIILVNMPLRLYTTQWRLPLMAGVGTAFTLTAATLIYRYSRYSQTKKVWREMLKVCKANLDLQKILQSHPSCMIQSREDELILSVGGARIGYVAHSKLPQDEGHIRFLLIRECDRGKGFGTLLMRYTIRFLEGQGCKKIKLLATPTSDQYAESLYKFYRNLGFKRIKEDIPLFEYTSPRVQAQCVGGV